MKLFKVSLQIGHHRTATKLFYQEIEATLTATDYFLYEDGKEIIHKTKLLKIFEQQENYLGNTLGFYVYGFEEDKDRIPEILMLAVMRKINTFSENLNMLKYEYEYMQVNLPKYTTGMPKISGLIELIDFLS